MQIACGQFQVYPGEIEKNKTKILGLMADAKANNIQILLLLELCLTGYLLGDLWEELDFLEEAEEAGESIRQHTNADFAVVFGNIALDSQNIGENGRIRLFNSAWVAWNQNWVSNDPIGTYHFPKVLMPNYREFDDSRYFYDLRKLALAQKIDIQDALKPITLFSKSIGISICEDGWGEDYGLQPIDILGRQNLDYILNLSCSPFTLGKESKRNRVFAKFANKWNAPLFYCNCTGVQNNGKTVFGFDGASAIYLPNGDVATAKKYQEDLWDGKTHQKLSPHTEMDSIGMHLIFCTQNFMASAGLKRVTIGASGGIDSAVAAALFTQVLGPENVLLVNMPSKFNSHTTISLAEKLAKSLGTWYTSVSIEDSASLTKKQIHGLTINRKSECKILELTDFHLENVQARDRSSRVLSAVGCGFASVFSCNANKAETTVGYSTLYGDHGGFLAPLADLWKDKVYALGRWFQQKYGLSIPEGIFTIVPSAELSAKQDVDKDEGDPFHYEYHDKLFQSWIEKWNRATPTSLLAHYQTGSLPEYLGLPHSIEHYFPSTKAFVEDLERWWRCFKGMGVVKRVQAPPVIAITKRSFGFDYRESILPVVFSQKYIRLKKEILGK